MIVSNNKTGPQPVKYCAAGADPTPGVSPQSLTIGELAIYTSSATQMLNSNYYSSETKAHVESHP